MRCKYKLGREKRRRELIPSDLYLTQMDGQNHAPQAQKNLSLIYSSFFPTRFSASAIEAASVWGPLDAM